MNERRRGKKWWKSKTLWLNALLAAGTVIEANVGLLQAKLGPSYYLGVVGFCAAANAVLRVVTSEPLEGK